MGGGFMGGGFMGGGFKGGSFARATPMMTTPMTTTRSTTMGTTHMRMRTQHFPFVPVLIGGYGLDYPYLDYLNGNSNNAAAANGDNSTGDNDLPQANVSQPVQAAAIADTDDANSWAGTEYFAQAETAFREGRYRDALRLANHAAVEEPRDPKSHELMSLSLFALADYSGAAIEAHARIALGPIANWATLFGYYGDQERYTSQLRALEKYSRENPESADARFLQAYHYLMAGYIEQAKQQLAEAVELNPNDKLASELLERYGADADWSPTTSRQTPCPRSSKLPIGWQFRIPTIVRISIPRGFISTKCPTLSTIYAPTPTMRRLSERSPCGTTRMPARSINCRSSASIRIWSPIHNGRRTLCGKRAARSGAPTTRS